MLIFTIENELKDLVKQLLKNKEKDFLRTNDIGKSAISFVFNKIGNIVDPTSKKNNVEILIMLIKNGANLDIINTKGDTLLTFAVERENKELVELLLTKGINIHAVNSQRKSAIELAFQQKEYKDHEKVLIALIKSGAKVDIINTKGDTLLIFAADRGFKDLALLLIEGKNNDVNAVNAKRKAAIDFALQSENIKIIQKRRLVLLTHQNQRHSWLACHLYMGQTGRVRGASVGENAVCAEIRVRSMYAHTLSHLLFHTHAHTTARARAEMFRSVVSNPYFLKKTCRPLETLNVCVFAFVQCTSMSIEMYMRKHK